MTLWAVVRKELSDTVSSRSFLLCLFTLNVCMVLAGLNAGNTYVKYTTEYKQWFFIGVDPKVQVFNTVFTEMARQITTLGAIVAIAVSFNSINKERSEGSLKVLLSYPVYRDQVILGKLLAGFVTVSLVVVTSIALSSGIYLLYTNIGLTQDHLIRFSLFMFLSVLLLSFYLGLGMVFSIAFKDLSTTLLALILAIGVIDTETLHSFGRFLAVLIYGPALRMTFKDSYPNIVPANPGAVALFNFVSRLSPSWSFKTLSEELTKLVTYIGNPHAESITSVPIEVVYVLQEYAGCVAVMVVSIMATFVASYVLFTRSDIA